jgi:hypothetical protein
LTLDAADTINSETKRESPAMSRAFSLKSVHTEVQT